MGFGSASPSQAEADVSDFDLATMRAYLAAVATATDEFLAAPSATELAREVDTPMGTMAADAFLSGAATHLLIHSGEIAALKGVQGLKGLGW